MKLSEELRAKIRRRVRRALDGDKVHRLTKVVNHFQYRLSGGQMLAIKIDKIGRIYVPKEV